MRSAFLHLKNSHHTSLRDAVARSIAVAKNFNYVCMRRVACLVVASPKADSDIRVHI